MRDNGDIFNKDGDVRKKLLTGFQMSTLTVSKLISRSPSRKGREKSTKKWQAHLLPRDNRNLKKSKTVKKIFRKMLVFRKKIFFRKFIGFAPR